MSEPDLYTPDEDAGGLDKRLLQIARDLHNAGWDEEAVEIASNLAELREGVRNPTDLTDARVSDPYDQLSSISGAASRIAQILHQTYPDGIALRSAE